MNCIFCDFVNNKKAFYKVWENSDALAFLDINPINKGHVLLIPKEHHSDIFDVNDDLYIKLFSNAKKLSLKLKEINNSPRVGIIVEGFGVDHVHIHLVPIYNGNELNPTRAYQAETKELLEMQDKLSKVFGNIS